MIFDAARLKKALKEAGSIKNAHVHYLADGGSVIIAGDSLHLTIGGVEAKDAQDFAVPEKALKYIEAARSGELHVTLSDSAVEIRQGKAKAKYARELREAPTVPELGDCFRQELDVRDLANVLSSVRYAVAKNDTRLALMGVRLYRDDTGRLCAEASDGNQLARAETTQTRFDAEAFSVLIPADAVDRLLAVMDGNTAMFRHDGRRAEFAGASWALRTPLMAAAPYNFSRVYDSVDGIRPMVFDAPALADVVRRAIVALSGDRSFIRLNFKGSALEITANNAACDFNDLVEDADGEASGMDGLTVAYNPAFLLGAVTARVADRAEMRINPSALAMVVRLCDDEQGVVFHGAFMAVRTQEAAA